MIFLIRHGQTEFNREGRLQGRLDSPLTDLGVEQARRMGHCLKSFIDDPAQWRLIASPLGRARQTALIVREATGLACEIEFDSRLAEISVGDWEGLTRAEIGAGGPGDWMYDAPGGEGREALESRIRQWLASIDQTDGQRRIVVSHGVTGRLLRNLYAGGGHATAWQGESPPQDAVFLLHGGVVGRVDDGAADVP